jgi:hypothetical protein
MELFIQDGTRAARVTVTAVSGNTVTFTNTPIPSGVNFPNPNTTSVIQVILNVYAINEGEWGNNLRVSVTPAGRVATTLDMPGNATASPPMPAGLPPGATQAVLASLTGITTGMTLFISDGSAAARVQVTGIDEGARQITFVYLHATTHSIDNGARVTGTILGKASTVLGDDMAAGATEAVLQSTEGIEVGSVLRFVAENFGDATASPVVLPRVTEHRAVVTRVTGRRVFFTPALGGALPAGTSVSTEDFTLTVYDGNGVVETHTNLSMENTNITDYVEDRINSGATRSRYVRVREAGSPPVPDTANILPARTPVPRRLGALPTTAGNDGASEAAGDYIGNEAAQTGFYAFDTIDDINILAAPGITFREVVLGGMTYCENRGDCFFVGDVQREAETATQVLDFKNATGIFAGQQAFNSKYGAIYWPWIRILDPLTNRPLAMPPAGAVVGTYAATDVRSGVHKAPAGLTDGFLNTAIGIEKVVTKGEHDVLNPQGVNVIRSFPGAGIVIWGARTVSADPEWRYVNVRRLFLFLEESIDEGTQSVVFEPNDPTLWRRIRRNISAFLRLQWIEGRLVGNKEEEAFFVKCDAETNPPESVDLGRVVTLIGVAPSKPAEFVIFRISQFRGGSSVQE